MTNKIQIPEGVEPIAGSIFVHPIDRGAISKGALVGIEFETPPHQAAIVLLADPEDKEGEIKQGDMVYYGSHAASGVEVKGQSFLTVPRKSILGIMESE